MYNAAVYSTTLASKCEVHVALTCQFTFHLGVIRAGPGWSCSKAVYKPVWHIPLLSVQWINSWWWTDELSETCRVSLQNKFVKLVHLVGFITKEVSFYCPNIFQIKYLIYRPLLQYFSILFHNDLPSPLSLVFPLSFISLTYQFSLVSQICDLCRVTLYRITASSSTCICR